MEKNLHSFQQPSERLVFVFPVTVVCDAFLLQWAVQCLTGVLHMCLCSHLCSIWHWSHWQEARLPFCSDGV